MKGKERSHTWEYTEDVSKNRPGGLKNRKMKPKVVVHYLNEENPERCFVRLFKLNTSLCPQQSPKNLFYLQPLKKPQPNRWYSTKPIGHNTLEGTVARLCKNAGIQGYHTNHSLRATTVTRLFQAGVDEQLIMEKTGHTSLDAVRSYKRTSSTQQQCLSDILNTNSKSVISDLQSADKLALVPSIPRSDNGENHGGALVCNINNQSNNSLAMHVNQPPSFNFHSCSVINNNYGNQPM